MLGNATLEADTSSATRFLDYLSLAAVAPSSLEQS